MDSAVERLRPVLLFGGTTEGRELAARLAGRGQRTILCVATDYGREVLEPELLANPCLDVRIGRMDAEEMRRLILEEEPGLVVDATHPYADQVTRNVREACEKAGVRLVEASSMKALGQACGVEVRTASAGIRK